MRNFKELQVWVIGFEIANDVYKISRNLPKDEIYGLKSQINRASISIPANISEGCARSGSRDFLRFLEISLGSSYELETELMLIENQGLLPSDEVAAILRKINQQQKMLAAFIQKLKSLNARY